MAAKPKQPVLHGKYVVDAVDGSEDTVFAPRVRQLPELDAISLLKDPALLHDMATDLLDLQRFVERFPPERLPAHLLGHYKALYERLEEVVQVQQKQQQEGGGGGSKPATSNSYNGHTSSSSKNSKGGNHSKSTKNSSSNHSKSNSNGAAEVAKDDEFYREAYLRLWRGTQSEFVARYGDGDLTQPTLSKWLSRHTVHSPSCRRAVRRLLEEDTPVHPTQHSSDCSNNSNEGPPSLRKRHPAAPAESETESERTPLLGDERT